ncbi:TonB family protein [Salinisphaera sp. PC39]|uniref:energy transducer TonB family protein n=1 Tax=Salinisphaera sp. PC39 TaxID=1304156 RepID=UPI00333F3D15
MNDLLADWTTEADYRQRRRWLLSTLTILASGAAVAAALGRMPAPPASPRPPAAAMVIELAPALRAPRRPDTRPADQPQREAPEPTPPARDTPPRPEPRPKPEPETDPAPEPAPAETTDADLEPLPEQGTPAPAESRPPPAAAPQPKTTETTTQQAPAPTTAAPSSHRAAPAETATAPRQSAPSRMSSATRLTFQQRLLAYLERHKRYPRAARRRRQQGIAHVRFTMNRAGQVLDASLERGAGFDILDREALALLERAQPLPRIPDEIDRDELEIVVPIEFSLRR